MSKTGQKTHSTLQYNLDRCSRAIDVWRRLNESEAVRYRCFQNLLTGKYYVQGTDRHRREDGPERSAQLERQYIQLLIERPPDERSLAFDTLDTAIEAYDAEFGSPK